MTTLRVALWLAVSSDAQAKEDKASLKEQERVGREWVAAQPDAKIVKVFNWDGYSRSEMDVLTAYEDFAAQGRFEYHELRQMWQQHAFDVLWVYVHDRIARSTALYAQVMGNVIKSNARIFSHSDGWIDQSNVETFMAIGGFSASNDIHKLVKRRAMGMRQRLKEGRTTTSGVSDTHQRVRDPVSGKELGLVVNENKRRLFDDAAELILEGVGWRNIEQELYSRFGHVAASGQPYSRGRIYSLIMKPLTWGHNAMNFRSAYKGNSWAAFGEWIFEPGHPIPPGVNIEYNTVVPVYEGELAERLKAEIKFRMDSVRGNTPSKHKYWYTGLVVCRECGYYMGTYASTEREPRLKCATRWNQSHSRGECHQTRSVMASYLKEWFTARLGEMIESGGYSLLSQDEDSAAPDRDETLQADVDHLVEEIHMMVRDKRKAVGTALEAILEEQINEANELLGIRKTRLIELEQQSFIGRQAHNEQVRTLDMIRDRGLPWFWEQDAPFIRNSLLALLAGKRLAALDGQIKRLVAAPKFAHK